MTVLEPGEYLTVADVISELAYYPPDAPVTGICDGRQPLIGLVGSYEDYDHCTSVVLQLASIEDSVAID
jgi:hypothetical protein